MHRAPHVRTLIMLASPRLFSAGDQVVGPRADALNGCQDCSIQGLLEDVSLQTVGRRRFSSPRCRRQNNEFL